LTYVGASVIDFDIAINNPYLLLFQLNIIDAFHIIKLMILSAVAECIATEELAKKFEKGQ